MNDIEHTLPLWLQPAEISRPHRDISPRYRRAVRQERRDGLETGRTLSGGPGHRANYKLDLFARAAAVVTPVIAVATAAAMIFCIAST